MTIPRRTFFRAGAAGAAALWASTLTRRIDLATAAEGSAPLRVILMLEGDGFGITRFMPEETWQSMLDWRAAHGLRLPDQRGHGYYAEVPVVTQGVTLPPSIAPFAPHMESMNLVFGLSNKIASGTHTAGYGALSSSRSSRSTPIAQTFDHWLGQRLGSTSAFPVLRLGTLNFGTDSEDQIVPLERAYSTCAQGAGKPLPIWTNPPTVHRQLFGSVASAQARKEFELHTALLDKSIAQFERTRLKMGRLQKDHLDATLSSLETLKLRQSKLFDLEDVLLRVRPELQTDPYLSPHPLVRLEAQAELAMAALLGGLTQVVVLASGCSDNHFNVRYSSLHPEIPSKHHFGHGGSHQEQDKNHWLSLIHSRHSAIAAGMIQKLKDTPEAEGSMWDNTLLVYMPDGGEGHHASFADWPLTLFSGKNIPLHTSPKGRSVVFPRYGADAHRQLSNLWNTLGHAVGHPLDDFGQEAHTRVAKGPLSELLKTA